MSDESRRIESLWSKFIAVEDDRRDPGLASVGFEALAEVLDDVKAGRRPPQPDDLLNRWLESAFWAGYAKDFTRLAAFKHDIRERFGGQSIAVAPHNETSTQIARILGELGVQRTSAGPTKGNGGNGG